MADSEKHNHPDSTLFHKDPASATSMAWDPQSKVTGHGEVHKVLEHPSGSIPLGTHELDPELRASHLQQMAASAVGGTAALAAEGE